MSCRIKKIGYQQEKDRMERANRYKKEGYNPDPSRFLGPMYYNYLTAAESNPPVKRNRQVLMNSYKPKCRLDVDCKGKPYFDPADIDNCADNPQCIRDNMLETQYNARRRMNYQSINDVKKIGDYNPLKPFNPYFFVEYYNKYDESLA